MHSTFRYILSFLGFALLIFALWYLRTIVAYVLIAGVLSLIGSPIVNFLDDLEIGKFKFPRTAAAGVTLVLMVGVLVGFISLFAPLIAAEARAISNINVDQVISSLEEPVNQFEQWIASYNLSSSNTTEMVRERINTLLDFSNVAEIFSSLVGALGNIFVAFFSIVFITFFFLKEEGLFFKMFLIASPEKYTDQVKKVLVNTKRLLTRYFVGIIGQLSLITLLVTIGLSAFGIENAFIIGFFGGIINVIPYIGPIIGASVGIVLTITTNLSLDFYSELLPLVGQVALVFAAVQMLDNFVFQPFIFSNSVKAHPLEIFLVILIAGTVAGITGMILAIPSYTFIRIIAKEFLSQFKIVQSLTKNI